MNMRKLDGGKIVNIGDPIFFATNFYNIKLNGRFISKDESFPKNYIINSEYEIVEVEEEVDRERVEMKSDHEIMYVNEKVNFGPNEFNYYVLYINKYYGIINNIVEYLLTETYTYENESIGSMNRHNFVKKFLTKSGPYNFDKETYKFVNLSTGPNILHKYCFANKLKELMDILYTAIDDELLETEILKNFSVKIEKAKKSYENLSDIYNIYSKRVSSEENLKNVNFNETFIDILGVYNNDEKYRNYIHDDIEQIKSYKEFIKICDVDSSFELKYGIKLSILFFSVYIQTRITNPIISRGSIDIDLYPINKTNLILNILGNKIYDKEKKTELSRQINIKKKSKSLKESLTSQELLIYGQGLILHGYSRAIFKNQTFSNCVENALVQMLKSFCWTNNGYNIEIINGAKERFFNFIKEIAENPGYDNSQIMRNRFAEIISVREEDLDNVKFNSSVEGYCYNIKSTYVNFKYFLKYILNIEEDVDIFEEIRKKNSYIKDIKIKDLEKEKNNHIILIEYKDGSICSFEIYNGHSVVNVNNSIKLNIFEVNIQKLIGGFTNDSSILEEVPYSQNEDRIISINFIKNDLLEYFGMHDNSEKETFMYFRKISLIYKSDNYLLKFANLIIKNYIESGRFNMKILDRLVKVEDIYNSNMSESEMNIIHTMMKYFHGLKNLDTSQYEYIDIFYKAIHNTFTVVDIEKYMYLFESFILFYLYLNSSIFEDLHWGKNMSLDHIRYLELSESTKNSIFSFLLTTAKLNKDNNFFNPFINFSVLTYYLRQFRQSYKYTHNLVSHNYIESLFNYYLIKVFDYIIKREFNNSIFLFELVYLLSNKLQVYLLSNKLQLIKKRDHYLKIFINRNIEICTTFLDHIYQIEKVVINKDTGYGFEYNVMSESESDSWIMSNISQENISIMLEKNMDDIESNKLKKEMVHYLESQKTSNQVSNKKSNSYTRKYLELKKNMEGGKYQFLGINTKPFESKFPIFIGKRNIIKNTDPNSDINKVYVLNNFFELVKLTKLIELQKINPDDSSIPYLPIVEAYLPIKYLKNPNKTKIIERIKEFEQNGMEFFMPLSEFNTYKNNSLELYNKDKNISDKDQNIYKKMEKFISTNKFREFLEIVFNDGIFFTNEREYMKKIIKLIGVKDELIQSYNHKIKSLNSFLTFLKSKGKKVELDLVPDIIIMENNQNIPYIIMSEVRYKNNVYTLELLKNLDKTNSIETVLKFIKKFNLSNFVIIKQTIINNKIETDDQEVFIPNKDNPLVKLNDPILKMDELDSFKGLSEFVAQEIDFEQITKIERVVKKYLNLFPNLQYYQNLSDSYEYYFNSEIDGNLYIYKNIKEINSYIYEDIEFIHKLKSNNEYNKEYFVRYITLIINDIYKLQIPIHEASLYENLFGI